MAAKTCTGKTKAGKPCKNRPMKDREVCKAHSGDANVGAKSKLTREVIDTLCLYISRGVPIKHAVIAAGICERTYYDWLDQAALDQEHDRVTMHTQFSQSTTRARSQFLAAMALQANKHAVGFKRKDGSFQEGDPKMIQWLLERRGGPDWRQSVEIDLEGRVRTEAPQIPDSDERMKEAGGILRDVGVLDG